PQALTLQPPVDSSAPSTEPQGGVYYGQPMGAKHYMCVLCMPVYATLECVQLYIDAFVANPTTNEILLITTKNDMTREALPPAPEPYASNSSVLLRVIGLTMVLVLESWL